MDGFRRREESHSDGCSAKRLGDVVRRWIVPMPLIGGSGLARALQAPRLTDGLSASALRLSYDFGMPNYRRYRVPGGTSFFTVNLLERRLDRLVQNIDA